MRITDIGDILDTPRYCHLNCHCGELEKKTEQQILGGVLHRPQRKATAAKHTDDRPKKSVETCGAVGGSIPEAHD